MKEPSVLDYIQSKLMPWKYPHLELPGLIDAARQSNRSEPPADAPLSGAARFEAGPEVEAGGPEEWSTNNDLTAEQGAEASEMEKAKRQPLLPRPGCKNTRRQRPPARRIPWRALTCPG